MTFDPIRHFPGQTDLLGWCELMSIGTAVLLIVMGVVYLLYGWAMYKALITLNAAMVGAYVGALVGQRAGGYVMAGGLLGAVVSASIAWPLMKWAVAIMGGICGAVVGASIWLLVGLEPRFAWAGGMTGLVGFGLCSFIVFRGSIITYTSLQGSMMFIVGVLGIIFKWEEIAPSLARNMTTQRFMLPMFVVIPAILGLIYQQMHAPAGAGGAGAGAKPPEKK